ncbi:MAG: hypothetical protein ACRD1U_04120 [Vicinamibacterales bacterium]
MFSMPRGLPALRLVLVVALCAAACAGRRQQDAALEHSFESLDALATSVLDAVASRDRDRLEQLALSEHEFRTIVWPALPAARPERNLTWDYVWSDLRQKSRASVMALLFRHGGRRYTLLGVKHLGKTTQYADFEVQRATELSVATSTGERATVRLFGSTIRRHGRFKLFSYNVD